jgi:predicted dinucleotide-binding enzyme
MVSQAFAGAKLVKVFSHLPAGIPADPNVNGDRRVIFGSSNNETAVTRVAAYV